MPARTGTIVLAAGLGLVHALVDVATVSAVMAEVAQRRWTDEAFVYQAILLYNCTAFGLQLPLGMLGDRWGSYRPLALLGVGGAAAALGAGAAGAPLVAAVAGVGNALFHVGAGALVLRAAPGRATEPALFVAPGAAGLALGTRLGEAGLPERWGLAVLLGVAFLILSRMRLPAPRPGRRTARTDGTAWLHGCIALLLVSVAIRSLVGEGIAGHWRRLGELGVALCAAAVGGKAFGGPLADALGWRRVGVGALVLAAPLALRATSSGAIAVASAVLAQMTMGVTLAAIFVLYPARPGMAFGLPSLALLLGVLPVQLRIAPAAYPEPVLASILLLSALALAGGLRAIETRSHRRPPTREGKTPAPAQ